jgi:hypothetical protein
MHDSTEFFIDQVGLSSRFTHLQQGKLMICNDFLEIHEQSLAQLMARVTRDPDESRTLSSCQDELTVC